MVAFFWVVGKFNLLEADTCHGNTESVPLSTLVSVIRLRALGHWPTRTVSARFKCREFEVRALPSDPTKDIIKALWARYISHLESPRVTNVGGAGDVRHLTG